MYTALTARGGQPLPQPPPTHTHKLHARNKQDDASTCLALLALSTAVFRCDTLVLAVPLLLTLLLRRQLSWPRLLLLGSLSGLGGIGGSSCGDWGRTPWCCGLLSSDANEIWGELLSSDANVYVHTHIWQQG